MASVHPKVTLDLPVNGLRPDLDDFHVPPDSLRSTSYNWMLRNGRLVTCPGLTTFGQALGTFPPIGMIAYHSSDNAAHTVHSTTQKWWHYNIALNLWEDISDPASVWSGALVRLPCTFRVFNSGGISYLLGVNGFNTPRAWNSNPANAWTFFGGSAPVARCMCIVADRVVLGHLDTGSLRSNTIDVSAFQDHTSGWGVTQTAVLFETPGFIASMLELGFDQAAVYKTESIYLLSGTTGLAPVRIDLHIDQVDGPASPAGVVSITSSLHAVFTRHGQLYLFDGINYTPHPSSDRVRLLYEQNATQSPISQEQTHAFYDAQHNELWWFYVRVGDESIGPRDAIIINLSNGSVWKRDYTHLSFGFRMSYSGNRLLSGSTSPKTFLGSATGQIYLSEGGLDVSTPIPVVMESGLSNLGDSTQIKTIEEAEHFFAPTESEQTPSVSFLTSNAGGPVQESEPQAITIDAATDGPYVTGHRGAAGERISARYIGMKIEDATVTSQLEYRGSAITVVPRGGR